MTCNVLILAAGRIEDKDEKRQAPLCLSEIEGRLLIEWVLESTRQIVDAKYFFAILEEDIRQFYLDELIKQLISNVTIVRVPEDTKGSACTALFAAVSMAGDLPLLIVSSNEFIRLDLNKILIDFNRRSLDAGTLTFRALHPRYSFVRLNAEGHVEEAAQHRPISKHATTGTFWFARTEDFVESSMNLIRKDASDRGNFYIAPVFNEMVLKQATVGIFPLPSDVYVPLKNEEQVKNYEPKG